MKCLVTGGSGFIGSWIVENLLPENQVAVIDIQNSSNLNHLKEKITFYKEDITNHPVLDDIFKSEKPDIVFHLAANALLRKSLVDPLGDAQVNILGTISVLEACRKNAVKKIIYFSTGGARVGEPQFLPVHEDHPLRPLSPYGISKHSAEHYVEAYYHLYGIEYFIFCFGNVYGPRDQPASKRLIPIFMDQILRGESPVIFGDGNQTRDFIYVEDLAEFIVQAIDKFPITQHRLFNLANGKQTSVLEICRYLEKIKGKSIYFIHKEAIKGEVRDIVLDISRAQQELRWQPKTSLEEGLQKTWKWFKENINKIS